MDHSNQTLMQGNLQLRTRPSDLVPQASLIQSASSEESSLPSSQTRPRRSSLPDPRSNIKTSPTKVNTAQPRARGTKSLSAGPRDKASHASIMNSMTGTMSAANEVTYTPTTHRISKAKKGKKVHACEFPGCTKIFTRAEHRKRHEANHNTEPLFQCEVEECRKPFQRSDLLARHMERQHNMPAESPLASGQQSRRAVSETSTTDASPPRSNLINPSFGQRQSYPSQPMADPSGTMSIGSIIEPTMRQDYASTAIQSFADYSHLPVPSVPRKLPAELIYGFSASDSPYCSSTSDASCYSPMSDLIQPQITTQSYHPQEDLPRSQSASLEASFSQQIYGSPITTNSSMPAWNFDQPPLSAPMHGSMQTSMVPTARRLHYPAQGVPTYTDANGMPYDIEEPLQWPYRKMTY